MKTIKLSRWKQRNQFVNLVYILIGINLAFYVAKMILNQGSFDGLLGLSVFGVVDGLYLWQFITYMFVHGNGWHLFFNMTALLFFGLPIEKKLGSFEFGLFYFFCGIFSGLISFLIYWGSSGFALHGAAESSIMSNVTLVGASGAIFGILFAFAAFFPHVQVYIMGVIPVKAWIMVLVFVLIEVFGMLYGFVAGSNVAHLTHLAGAAGAWLYMLLHFHFDPIKAIAGSASRHHWKH